MKSLYWSKYGLMVLRSYCRHDENSDTDMATCSLWIGLLVGSPQSDLVSDIKILWYVFLQLNNQTVNLHFYSYCDVTSKNFTFFTRSTYTYIHVCCSFRCSGTGKGFSNRKETSCLPLLNAGFEAGMSQTPIRQQTECPLINLLSYRGSS